jgi:subtilisin family serine protease
MKRAFSIFVLLAILIIAVVPAAANGGRVLYVPDMTDAEFAGELLVTDPINGLGGILPYWSDMVDTENITEDGDGVYVAILDTGLLPQWPFFFSEAEIATEYGIGFTHNVYWDDDIGDIAFGPLDDTRGYMTELASGHGTHVASVVTGFNYNNLYWVNGIAPKVKIIPVLVLDAWIVDTPSGLIGLSGGTDEMVAAGIEYIANLSDELDGPVVINMSLGGPGRSQLIEDAVDYAIEKGVIVVASAGNEDVAGMGYPGGLSQIISAGAAGWTEFMGYYPTWYVGDVPEKLKSKDSLGNNAHVYLEDFSSRPNKDLDQKHQDLDVSTPGAWVVGPYKPVWGDNNDDVAYYYVSGTSQAAPHVSGIAALVLQKHAEVHQFDMEFLLERAAAGLPLSADDAIVAFVFGSYYIASWDGGDFGKGFLQADAALFFADVLH